MSFDDDFPPVETLVLSIDDLNAETAPTSLRFVKYQSVNHLTIFVVDGHGNEDVTQIEQVLLYGTPIDMTKPLSEIQNGDEHDH